MHECIHARMHVRTHTVSPLLDINLSPLKPKPEAEIANLQGQAWQFSVCDTGVQRSMKLERTLGCHTQCNASKHIHWQGQSHDRLLWLYSENTVRSVAFWLSAREDDMYNCGSIGGKMRRERISVWCRTGCNVLPAELS